MHLVKDRRITRLLRDLRSVFASAEALCDLHGASPSERAEYIESTRQRCNQPARSRGT